MGDLDELYQEAILDHHRTPRNNGELIEANHKGEGFNPLCGDRVNIYIILENDVIENIKFEGEGCAISVASASMMTESVKGKTKDEAEALFNDFHAMLMQETDSDQLSDGLGKLVVFKGIWEFPVRVKCASLPWHTFNAALNDSSNSISTE